VPDESVEEEIDPVDPKDAFVPTGIVPFPTGEEYDTFVPLGVVVAFTVTTPAGVFTVIVPDEEFPPEEEDDEEAEIEDPDEE